MRVLKCMKHFAAKILRCTTTPEHRLPHTVFLNSVQSMCTCCRFNLSNGSLVPLVKLENCQYLVLTGSKFDSSWDNFNNGSLLSAVYYNIVLQGWELLFLMRQCMEWFFLFPFWNSIINIVFQCFKGLRIWFLVYGGCLDMFSISDKGLLYHTVSLSLWHKLSASAWH